MGPNADVAHARREIATKGHASPRRRRGNDARDARRSTQEPDDHGTSNAASCAQMRHLAWPLNRATGDCRERPLYDGSLSAANWARALERGFAALALTSAVWLLCQLMAFDYGRDQGIYSVVAHGLLQGEAPYRDVWDFKPPGIFLVFA